MSTFDSIIKDFEFDFTQMSIDTLIANFNREVGLRAGTAARLAFNLVNINELQRRGIDVSAVYDGTVIKFSKRVELDTSGTKLVLCQE